jgi:hypothetical protein
MIVAEAPSASPSIKSLKERHHEIKRRLVAGDRAIDIARSIGMTASWLSIVMSSPVFQVEMERERQMADENAADVAQRLTRLAPDAMTVLERAVRGIQQADGKIAPPEGISPALQTNVARDILDRAGHGKPVAAAPSSVAVTVQLVQFSSSDAVHPRVIEAKREDV